MPNFHLRLSNLRTRILAWSFVPTAIILMTVALVILFAYQQVTEDLVAGKNRELARLSASQVASDLQEYTNQLTALAQNPDIRLGIDSLQRIALARAKNNLGAFNAGVVILDSHGLVNAVEPPNPDWIEQDWSARPYFARARETKHALYSDFIANEQGQAVLLVVPILGDQEAFRGVIAGVLRVEPVPANGFYQRVTQLQTQVSGKIILVDSTGRAIFHSDPARIGGDLRDHAAAQQLLKSQAGNLRTRDENGNEILASFAPIPGTAWGLVIEENWSGLLSASQGYGRFLFALLALGVIVPAIVVAVGVRRITEPIAQMNHAAQAIAGGKFGQQIETPSQDELGALATQFNRMSTELAESYTQLEARVAARTHELATLNAVAQVVSGSLDLNEIMRAALHRAMTAMRMSVGAAYSVNENEWVLIACEGLSADFSPRGVTESQPTVWRVADYPDARVKSALEGDGLRQIINIPLIAKGKLVGAFNLGTRKPREITPEEIALLAGIGQQVAVAVENARLYDQAEQSAALAERTRLARELHDSVTQSLYGVTMYAEAAQLLLTQGNPSPAAEYLRELRDTAQEALREMRLLIYELRPLALEQHGLVAALQERLETVEARGGVKTELHIEGVEELSLALQHELYYIAREALNNILKHARAQMVRLRLCINSEICLEICDDGIGFDANDQSKGGLGFAGMNERVQKIGGTLQITTATGHGTTLTICVPLPAKEER